MSKDSIDLSLFDMTATEKPRKVMRSKKAQPKQEETSPVVEDTNAGEMKILKSEVSSLQRQLSKVSTAGDVVREVVQEAYGVQIQPAAFKKPKTDKRKLSEEIAVLHLSDIHIGKRTATYDSIVAGDRIEMLINKVLHITDIRRNGAVVDEIHVYLGGDIVEGEEIFPHQPHTIDSPLLEQAVRKGPLVLSKAILSLAENFPRVKVVGVRGNHGRNGKRNATTNHPKTNWDLVAYEIARLMVLGSEDNPNTKVRDVVEWELNDDFYAVDYVFNWGNLLVHGDQIGGGFAGFPFYGAAKKAWGWIDSIDNPWDYLWFGHFHTFASGVLNHRIYLSNGTTESDNEFARANMASAGFPCQRLAFFEEKYGLISDNQIYLTEEGTRKPQKCRFANAN